MGSSQAIERRAIGYGFPAVGNNQQFPPRCASVDALLHRSARPTVPNRPDSKQFNEEAICFGIQLINILSVWMNIPCQAALRCPRRAPGKHRQKSLYHCLHDAARYIAYIPTSIVDAFLSCMGFKVFLVGLLECTCVPNNHTQSERSRSGFGLFVSFGELQVIVFHRAQILFQGCFLAVYYRVFMA